LNAPTGYVSYLWSTGSTAPTIIITAAGSYWVDDVGSSCNILIDTFNVTFKALPVVALGNDTSFCQGDSVILISGQPAGDTYLWNTGSTLDSIHVSASGTYWLTVSNGCTATDSIHILVSPIPLVNLGPDTSECSGLPIVLQSSYTYTGATYLWSNATTGATSTITATGTYWLQVTVGGCPGADTIHVTIAYDTFTLHTPDAVICKGASVQVLVTGNPAQTYQWLPTAGIPVAYIGSPIITPDTSATYVVTVFYPGCPDIIDSVHIDVQPNPVVYLAGNRSVCDHDTLHLTASVSPQWYTGYTYSWSPFVSLDNSTTPTVVFTAGDSTEIILTVTTPAGCKGVDSTQIIVYPDSFVHYDTSITICPGDSVQLHPLSDEQPTTYLWRPGLYMNDTTSSAPKVYPITSQSYFAIATNQYGCHDTVVANITVQPAALLYLGDSVMLYPGQSYQINPQTNCTSFMWLPPAGLSDAFIANPLADPLISTKYVVYGTTEWGCTIKDSINIYVDPNSLLAIPNAFTPGNGPNNLFKIILNGKATLNYFRIYNRWGNLVYESTDINEGWDGTYNGQPQLFDVYVYEVEAVTSNGTVFRKSGNVTLIR
jgi:gliding motility-associated-like protein